MGSRLWQLHPRGDLVGRITFAIPLIGDKDIGEVYIVQLYDNWEWSDRERRREYNCSNYEWEGHGDKTPVILFVCWPDEEG